MASGDGRRVACDVFDKPKRSEWWLVSLDVGRSEETEEVLVSSTLSRLCFGMPVSLTRTATSTAREVLQMQK